MIYFIILLFIVLIISAIIFIYMRKNKMYKNISIPKIIWTYWHDLDNIPITVSRCMDTWKSNNPDYDIKLLDKKSALQLLNVDLKKTFPNLDENSNERTSDYIRIMVVKKYGGFWIDSSIILLESLDWIHKIQSKTNSELFAYYAPQTTNKNYPIMENWFFAAIPESKFIKDWLKEVKYMSTFKTELDYVNSIKKNKNIDLQQLEKDLPYLIMHLCASVVYQRNKYNIYWKNSLEGPFKYLENSEWKLPKSFENLCKNNKLIHPIIKLRGEERKYLENNKNECNSKISEIKYVLGRNNNVN